MTSGDKARRADRPGETARRIEIHRSTRHKSLCPPDALVSDLCCRILDCEDVPFDRVGIVLADHDIVTDLNRRYLDHDWHTDVLSFRLNDELPIEGEVYVDVETAVERCEEFGATPDEEVLRYVAHGLLHLAGYDDRTDEDRALMRGLENRYLSGPD